MQPRISVLFPVYNGEKYLKESIDSILRQTYKAFELLILLEYGSNQSSKDIVFGYSDSRITIIQNQSKLGLAESLNVGIRAAKGEFIARMDADDVSFPDRFKKQVDFLDKHRNIIMCGTAIIGLYDDGHREPKGYFTDSDSIKFEGMIGNPFAHPTVMWRREEFMKEKFFYRDTPYSEDFELWKRVIAVYPCANLSEPLLLYRLHGESASTVYGDILGDTNNQLNKEYLQKYQIEYDMEGSFWTSQLTESEIRKREEILIQICNLWEEKRGIQKVLEQRIRGFYIGNHCYTFRRYWSVFSFVYNNDIYDNMRLRLVFISHKIGRPIRLMLEKMK